MDKLDLLPRYRTFDLPLFKFTYFNDKPIVGDEVIPTQIQTTVSYIARVEQEYVPLTGGVNTRSRLLRVEE